MVLFNLTNVIPEPTRVTEHSITLIDTVIVSDSCNVLDSGVIPNDPNVSDNRATYVSLRTNLSLRNNYQGQFSRPWASHV